MATKKVPPPAAAAPVVSAYLGAFVEAYAYVVPNKYNQEQVVEYEKKLSPARGAVFCPLGPGRLPSQRFKLTPTAATVTLPANVLTTTSFEALKKSKSLAWYLENTAVVMPIADGRYYMLAWHEMVPVTGGGTEAVYPYSPIPCGQLARYHPPIKDMRKVIRLNNNLYTVDMARPGGSGWTQVKLSDGRVVSYPWDIRFVHHIMQPPAARNEEKVTSAAKAVTAEQSRVAAETDAKWQAARAAIKPTSTQSIRVVPLPAMRSPLDETKFPIELDPALAHSTQARIPGATDAKISSPLIDPSVSITTWKLAETDPTERVMVAIVKGKLAQLSVEDGAVLNHAMALASSPHGLAIIAQIAIAEAMARNKTASLHIGQGAGLAELVELMFGESAETNGTIDITRAATAVFMNTMSIVQALGAVHQKAMATVDSDKEVKDTNGDAMDLV